MKKKVNVILFILVCGIWAAIAYKYFYVKEIQTDYFVNSHNSIPIQNAAKDTFELLPLHRDPFLGTITYKAQKSTEQPLLKSPKTEPKLKKENLPWPQIEYMGFIKAHGNEKELVILKINGKIYRTRKTETVQNVFVKDIFKDSVIVRLNKEQMTILKINKK